MQSASVALDDGCPRIEGVVPIALTLCERSERLDVESAGRQSVFVQTGLDTDDLFATYNDLPLTATVSANIQAEQPFVG